MRVNIRGILGYLLLAVIVFSPVPVSAGGGNLVDFSAPEKTIDTYYQNYADREILSACFYPQGYQGSIEKTWLSYDVVAKSQTSKTGKTFSGVDIDKNAVEVTVQVKMNHAPKGNPTTTFWYLLQEINGDWKIIDHSHMPDKNYPAHD